MSATVNATRLAKALAAVQSRNYTEAEKQLRRVVENVPPIPRASTLKRVRNEERQRAIRLIRQHVRRIGPLTTRAINDIGVSA